MGKQYVYEGAVYAFRTLASDNWKASTWAESKGRAVANLKHRFRREFNYAACTPLDLPGRIEEDGGRRAS